MASDFVVVVRSPSSNGVAAAGPTVQSVAADILAPQPTANEKKRKWDSSGDTSPAASKPKKKQRWPTPKRQNRNSPLMKLSVEIFVDELAPWLAPRELFLVSMLAKAFRYTLRDPDKPPIAWRNCIANNAGMPPCPTGLTEIQYFSLICGTGCNGCPHNNKATFIDFTLRLRLCRDCRAKSMTPKNQALALISPFVRDYSFAFASAHVSTINLDAKHSSPQPGETTWYLTSRLLAAETEYRNAILSYPLPRSPESQQFIAQTTLAMADRWYRERRYVTPADSAIARWKRQQRDQEILDVADIQRIRSELILNKLSERGWNARRLVETNGRFKRIVMRPLPVDDEWWPRIYRELLPFLAEHLTQHENSEADEEVVADFAISDEL